MFPTTGVSKIWGSRNPGKGDFPQAMATLRQILCNLGREGVPRAKMSPAFVVASSHTPPSVFYLPGSIPARQLRIPLFLRQLLLSWICGMKHGGEQRAGSQVTPAFPAVGFGMGSIHYRADENGPSQSCPVSPPADGSQAAVRRGMTWEGPVTVGGNEHPGVLQYLRVRGEAAPTGARDVAQNRTRLPPAGPPLGKQGTVPRGA